MSKKSHTPPCQRQSKSPSAQGFRSISRKNVICNKFQKRRQNISCSRSASRLMNQSERGQSKSYRRPHRDFTNQHMSLGKKKESFSQAQIDIIVNQFQHLKTAYEDLLQTKRKQSQQINNNEQILQQNVKYKRQNQKLRNQNEYYRQEFQRIKKECVKLIEIEGFKIKKLEETLQEKELMLQYLRNQNPLSGQQPNNVFLQSTPIFKSPQNGQKQLPNNLSLLSLEEISAIQVAERNNFLISSIQGQNRITISSQDSLVFSRDKSKSNNIYLQSMNLSSPKQDQPTYFNRLQINCPTFDLKQVDNDRTPLVFIQQKSSKRKHLKIDTDTKSLMNPSALTQDDLITHSTKKRINITSHSNDSQNLSSFMNIDRKKKKTIKQNDIQKINVSLPGKDKKSTTQIKHSNKGNK